VAKYLLKIPSQVDQTIYDCFAGIVMRCPDRLVMQSMHVLGDLELRPGFDQPAVSTAVKRILDSAVKVIQRLTILLDGLKVEYLRGEAEAIGSLYDRVYFSIESPTTLPIEELTELVVTLAKKLKAVEVQRVRDVIPSLQAHRPAPTAKPNDGAV
jgi:hypothetical protein